MAKFGKKYVEAAKKVDRTKTYSVAEAVKLAKETNIAKFDASVEVSFKLNVDPRHADQQIRGAMVLPHGTGKTQKVCVITQGPKEQEAKDAGADFVGGKELLEDIQKGWFDFDVIVATPNMMGELGKLGRTWRASAATCCSSRLPDSSESARSEERRVGKECRL